MMILRCDIIQFKVKRKSNAKRFRLSGVKNGRKRGFTLIEVEYADHEDNRYPGFACLGSKGGMKRNYQYIGESLTLAVQAVVTQFEVVVMHYEQVFE